MKISGILMQMGVLRPSKIMYIGGSDVLPPPLKGEEEQAMLDRLTDGDEEAKQILIEHNLRLVVYIARRFENTGVNLEDLISAPSVSSRRWAPSGRTRKSSWPPIPPAVLRMKF